MEHSDQKNSGEERIYLVCISRLCSWQVTAGTQGKNMEGGTRSLLLIVSLWHASRLVLSHLSLQPRIICLGMVPSTESRALLHELASKKCLTDIPRVQYDGGNSSSEFLFFQVSWLSQTDNKNYVGHGLSVVNSWAIFLALKSYNSKSPLSPCQQLGRSCDKN